MGEVFSSLRARVLVLIAIPFAVMLGMTVYHTLGEREDRIANAGMHVLDTARLMAGEQQRIIEHVHQVLSSAALLPEVRRGVASEECSRALAERLHQEPSLANISLARANGDVICNATPTARRINIADRDHFKAAIQTRQFYADGYIISRSTGRPSIGFGYPVLDEGGIPRAVVAISLSLAWLKQELPKAQLPEGALVTVVDGQGLVLARPPDPEGWVGKSAAELSLFKSLLAKGGNGTAEGIGLDGLRRIFGFVPLYRTTSGQAYLSVGIPKSVIVGPAERIFVVNLLVELVLLVLTFLAVWLGGEAVFVRPVAALTAAAKELGKGNLAARAGLKASGYELGQLAQSFDRMANAYQHHEEILRKSMEESIQAIFGAEEMRDPYTARHQARVGTLAAAIASELGLAKDEVHGIQLAASIHDVGKMHVPADLLSKRGKLTDTEYPLYMAHAQAGYDILKGIAFPWPIAAMVWQHHERLDGSGYPQGLKGEQILLGSRIIAVANVVEDMVSAKPYRPGLGIEAALKEIERERGTYFDPAVVDACLKLFREGRFAFQG